MDAVDLNQVVTLVIHHKVRLGDLEVYERWLRRAVQAAKEQPGHLGVNVIRPDGDQGMFTTVVRFARASQLDSWINSPRRRQLVEEVLPLLEEGDHPLVHADPEFWFTPEHPQLRPVPKWKQAVLSYLIICPLAWLVPWLWRPLFARYPALASGPIDHLLITFSIVVPVVFLFMPLVTRLCAGWLRGR